MVREIEEEDGADEDAADEEDTALGEDARQGVRAAGARPLLPPATRLTHPAQGRKRASPAPEEGKSQQAAETWDAMSSRVRSARGNGAARVCARLTSHAQLAAVHGAEFVGAAATREFLLKQLLVYDLEGLPEGTQAEPSELPLFSHPAVRALVRRTRPSCTFQPQLHSSDRDNIPHCV